MIIHWKALKEHYMMAALVLRLNQFRGSESQPDSKYYKDGFDNLHAADIGYNYCTKLVLSALNIWYIPALLRTSLTVALYLHL
jgi:hypothetical protein